MTTENPLRKAILDDETEEARRLIVERPELINAKNASPNSVLDLALAKDTLSLVVALVEAGAKSASWEMQPDFIWNYMSFMSAGLCAGWLSDIEFEAYARLQGGEPADDGIWAVAITDRDLQDLKLLSKRFNSWATHGQPFVSIEEWLPLFEDWSSKH